MTIAEFVLRCPGSQDRNKMAFDQMRTLEQQLIKVGKMDEYNNEIKNLLDRGVVHKFYRSEMGRVKLEKDCTRITVSLNGKKTKLGMVLVLHLPIMEYV